MFIWRKLLIIWRAGLQDPELRIKMKIKNLEYMLSVGRETLSISISQLDDDDIYILDADDQDLGAIYYHNGIRKWIGTQPFAVYIADEIGAFIEVAEKFS